jgi:hypothetical protein
LAFKAEGSIHYWLSKGGGSTIGFQMGSPLSKSHLFTLSPVLMGKKGEGVPTIALYFTHLENVLKIINTDFVIILSVGLIFVNIIIHMYLYTVLNLVHIYGFVSSYICICIFFNIETEVLSLTVLSMSHNKVFSLFVE